MTTQVISKIGATNSPVTMDYTSLQAWLDACPADLTTVDQVWIGEVYNQGEIVVSSSINKTITTDWNRRVILRAATGAGFKDDVNAATNPLRYNPTVGAAISGSVGYDTLFVLFSDCEIYGLQFRQASTNGRGTITVGGGDKLYLHECIFSHAASSQGHSVVSANPYGGRGGASALFVDNSLINDESTGASGVSAVVDGTFNNLTIVALNGSGQYGILGNYNDITATDCAVFGYTACFFFGRGYCSLTGANNATDNATFNSGGQGSLTATGSVTSVPFTTATFQNLSGVTFGSGTGYDFRLASGSMLIDAGTAGTSTDILGTSRPQGSATDIGAFEAPSSGPYIYSDSTTETGSAGDSVDATRVAASSTYSDSVSEQGSATDAVNVLGSGPVISKIGATNSPVTMDYTSLQAWLDACPADLTAVDQVWIGEVYNQGEIDVGSTTVSKTITTDWNRRVILRAAAGASFKDNASVATNPLRYNATVGAAITGNPGYTPLFYITADFETYGLQWRDTAASSERILRCSTGRLYIHESIVSGVGHNGLAAIFQFGSGNSVAENTLVVLESAAMSGIELSGSSGTTVTNCTVVNLLGATGGSFGVKTDYGNMVVNNCAIFGFGTALTLNGGTVTGNNNATDAASLGGSTTGAITSVPYTTATFQTLSGVTAGSGTGYDFRLASGSLLIDAGVTSTSADILGTTRPQGSATDIGAFEAPAAGPYTYSVTTTEAGTASDSAISVAQYPGVVAETGVAMDASGGGITTSRTVAETGAASDSTASVAQYPRAVAETGAASDSSTSVARYSRTVAESGAASDTSACIARYSLVVTETGSAVDTTTAISTTSATIAETGAAADSNGVSQVVNGPVVISKIGATNSPLTMDYTSLQAWLDACPADLTVANQQWIGEVYNQGEIVVSATITKTITTDWDRRVILRAATGHSFKDNANASTNPLRYNPAVGAAIRGSIDSGAVLLLFANCEISGLQFCQSSAAGQGTLSINANKFYVHEIICHHVASSRTHAVLRVDGGDGNLTPTVENSLITDETTGSIGVYGTNSETLNNLTIVALNGGGDKGIGGNYDNINTTNCAVFGYTYCWTLDRAYNSINGSNNATDNATFNGLQGSSAVTNSLTSVPLDTTTFQSLSGVTYGSGTGYDFRLASGSLLIDAGTSGTTTDIIGTTRPQGFASDIGAWEASHTAIIFSAIVPEQGTATDATNVTAILNGGSTEVGSVAETVSGSLLAAGTLSETGNTSDTISSSGILIGSVAEQGVATDTASGFYSTLDVSEIGSATDTVSVALGVDLSETLTAIETSSAIGILAAISVESIAAMDSLSAQNHVDLAISETLSATDFPDLSGRSVTEAGSAVDIVDAEVNGDVALTDILNSIDASDGQVTFALAIGENCSAIDMNADEAIFGGTVIESIAVVDELGLETFLATLEQGLALDGVNASITTEAGIVETGNATDQVLKKQIQIGLYPAKTVSFESAIASPPLVYSSALTLIPISIAPNTMTRLIVTQVSLGQDYSLRVWLSKGPDGDPIGQPWIPNRMPNKIRLVCTPETSSPSDVVTITLPAGDYYINVLNLTNTASMFSLSADLVG